MRRRKGAVLIQSSEYTIGICMGDEGSWKRAQKVTQFAAVGAVSVPGRSLSVSGGLRDEQGLGTGMGVTASLAEGIVFAKAQMGVTAGYGERQELQAVWCCRSFNRRVRNGKIC